MNAERPVIIIGAGGHAKVLAGLLDACGVTVAGLTDSDPAKHGSHVLGHPVLGGDDVIGAYDRNEIDLVMGVGCTTPGSPRRRLFEELSTQSYRFRTCIHPSAWVSPDTVIGIGTQVMAGAVIQPGCSIGGNVIINTRASVDHDCRIGAHTHIAPGTVLGGCVSVGEGVHIGIGASVIEARSVGDGAMVAAGATVIRDVTPGERVAGVPAMAMAERGR